MIAIQTGVRNNKLKIINAQDSLKWIAEYKPLTFNSKELSQFKENQAEYFLSGKINPQSDGSYIRNNSAVESRDLVVIDYDDLEITGEQLIKHIEDKLKDYRYVIYPTISNDIKGTRYRLIVQPERALNKAEFEYIFNELVDKIKIHADYSSSTFSQIQGLPVHSKDVTDYKVIFNDGKPYPVSEVINLTNQSDYTQHGGSNQYHESNQYRESKVSEEQLDELVQNYITEDWENLRDEHQYINVHYSILKDINDGLITFEQGLKYVEWLAGGNVDWIKSNKERLHSDFKRRVKPVTKWSFISKVKLFDEERNTLEYQLGKLGDEKRKKNVANWITEGSKGRKPSKLTPLEISLILQELLIFIVFEKDENARVAVYLEEEGIYTQNEGIIRRLIKYVERKATMNDSNEVIYDLKHTANYKPRTNTRYLIPVGNGVFNLLTRELEPFTPDYIFTSKITSNYVDDPILPIIDGWNVEDWLMSVANNDTEIKKLLWEVISASLNGNYSRRQSIWLVGDGRNGKGTFQDLIRNLVGNENVATLKINQFQERFALPMLEGKTVCIGDDVPAGVYVDDSSNFNSVVTGDTVAVEHKMKPMYSTVFYLTVIQSTNGMPKIHNKTSGTYRRLLIVPFNARFTVSNDNRAIKDDYIKRQEVLEYVLHKAIHMDFENFTTPEASKKAMKEYITENDPVMDFKESFFDEYDWTRVPTVRVYDFYKEFCEENNYKPLSQIKFTKQFEILLGDEWERKTMKFIGNEEGYPITFPADAKTIEAGKSYKSFVKIEK